MSLCFDHSIFIWAKNWQKLKKKNYKLKTEGTKSWADGNYKTNLTNIFGEFAQYKMGLKNELSDIN